MTFDELVDFARDRGFTVAEQSGSYLLRFRKYDNWVFEFTLPKKDLSIPKHTSLRWELSLKDVTTGDELFRDWVEEYGPVLDPIDEMKQWHKRCIERLANSEVRINERHLFSLFGRKFGRIRELQFQTRDGWQSLMA
jgi:hypothetical protein